MSEYKDGKLIEPVPEPKVETNIPSTDNSQGNQEVARELSMRPFREFFNISDTYHDTKLERLVKWAKPDGHVSQEEAIQRLRTMSFSLGGSDFGESKLNKMYERVLILESLGSISKNGI